MAYICSTDPVEEIRRASGEYVFKNSHADSAPPGNTRTPLSGRDGRLSVSRARGARKKLQSRGPFSKYRFDGSRESARRECSRF